MNLIKIMSQLNYFAAECRRLHASLRALHAAWRDDGTVPANVVGAIAGLLAVPEVASAAPLPERRVTAKELAEWEQVESRATQGPWEVTQCPGYEGGSYMGISTPEGCDDVLGESGYVSGEDRAFLETARVAMPALLAEVRWLRGPVQGVAEEERALLSSVAVKQQERADALAAEVAKLSAQNTSLQKSRDALAEYIDSGTHEGELVLELRQRVERLAQVVGRVEAVRDCAEPALAKVLTEALER